MLRTALTRMLGIDYPIVQAGMGAEAGPVLAAAVSSAGGLGTLGSMGTPPDRISESIRRCRELTQRPFGLNVVTFETSPFREALLELAVAEKVPVVTLSFGSPAPFIPLARRGGARVLVQVQDLAGAQEALAAGPDALIVQGHEAGGHTGKRGTLGFVAQVLDIAGDTPVVAAGGIGSGRGLAAALAMGAAGVLMGTRFKATPEFIGSVTQKAAIVASDGDDTVADTILDVPYPMRWPDNVVGRALSSRFVDEWRGRDEELRDRVATYPMFGFLRELSADPETEINWAGQSAGLVDRITPAGEVVRTVVDEARRLLAAAPR